MYDIITFGSATRDIYMISKDFLVVGQKKFVTGKGICLSLGSKIEIKDIMFKSGGGGANTAVTFKNQGFKVGWCGMVGDDLGGQAIINKLKRAGVGVSFISKTNKKPTNYSVILTAPKKDRTILVYRGASNELTKKIIPWKKLEAKWFYLAPLSGKLCDIFENLVDFAEKNKIKIVINPGNSQLSLPVERLKRIFKKADILILNQEEASILTKTSFSKEKEVFQKLNELAGDIVVMTKGSEGVIVSDKKYFYYAKPLNLEVIDRNGAGDSFGAGFVSGFIKTKNIEKAIRLGIANSSFCLKRWGAEEGLLEKGQKYPFVRVARYKSVFLKS